MRSRPNKTLPWTRIVFGGLLLIIVLFLAEENIRGRIELSRYLEKMRMQGEKFTIGELTPPPAPPEKNGAGLLLGLGFIEGKVALSHVPGSMRHVAPGRAVAAAREPVWAIKQHGVFISTNGVTAWWRTNTSTDTPFAPGRPGGRGSYRLPMLITSEDLAEDVRAVSNSLAQVRAALEFPVLDHRVDYSAGFNLLLPHLAPEKNAAQWLRVASLSDLYETNCSAALESLLALAALAHVTTNEPLMLSQLVRLGIPQIGVSATWEALQVDGWTEEQLREWQDAMQPSDFVEAVGRALEMERAMGAATIDRSSEDTNVLLSLFDDISQMAGQPQGTYDLEKFLKGLQTMFLRFVYFPIWRLAWKDQDQLRLLHDWQPQIDAARAQARRPNWQQNAVKENNSDGLNSSTDGSPARLGSLLDRIRYPMSSMLGNAGTSALNRAVEGEAARELAVSALALHRWQLAHKNFPATLQELVPQFLPAVPIDPFDGQPLRYRRQEDGTFLLYSVGRNGKDEEGNAEPMTPEGRPRFLDTRDIVWPRAMTTEESEKLNTVAAERLRKSRVP